MEGQVTQGQELQIVRQIKPIPHKTAWVPGYSSVGVAFFHHNQYARIDGVHGRSYCRARLQTETTHIAVVTVSMI